jgi:hypothetical protein
MSDEISVEARLKRLEEQVGSHPAAPSARVERALKYLPYMAIAHVLIGAPTLLLSLVLAYATFVQADATQKMQQGGALPFISYGTSNANRESGAAEITLDLANNGVGPALLGPLEIRYQGQIVRNARDLLERCCGLRSGEGQSFAVGPGSGIAVRPGEAATILRITRTPANSALWERFNDERWKLRVRSCYCSIFEDCWIIDGAQSRPQPVQSCPANWSAFDSDGAPTPANPAASNASADARP